MKSSAGTRTCNSTMCTCVCVCVCVCHYYVRTHFLSSHYFADSSSTNPPNTAKAPAPHPFSPEVISITDINTINMLMTPVVIFPSLVLACRTVVSYGTA